MFNAMFRSGHITVTIITIIITIVIHILIPVSLCQNMRQSRLNRSDDYDDYVPENYGERKQYQDERPGPHSSSARSPPHLPPPSPRPVYPHSETPEEDYSSEPSFIPSTGPHYPPPLRSSAPPLPPSQPAPPPPASLSYDASPSLSEEPVSSLPSHDEPYDYPVPEDDHPLHRFRQQVRRKQPPDRAETQQTRPDYEPPDYAPPYEQIPEILQKHTSKYISGSSSHYNPPKPSQPDTPSKMIMGNRRKYADDSTSDSKRSSEADSFDRDSNEQNRLQIKDEDDRVLIPDEEHQTRKQKISNDIDGDMDRLGMDDSDDERDRFLFKNTKPNKDHHHHHHPDSEDHELDSTHGDRESDDSDLDNSHHPHHHHHHHPHNENRPMSSGNSSKTKNRLLRNHKIAANKRQQKKPIDRMSGESFKFKKKSKTKSTDLVSPWSTTTKSKKQIVVEDDNESDDETDASGAKDGEEPEVDQASFESIDTDKRSHKHSKPTIDDRYEDNRSKIDRQEQLLIELLQKRYQDNRKRLQQLRRKQQLHPKESQADVERKYIVLERKLGALMRLIQSRQLNAAELAQQLSLKSLDLSTTPASSSTEDYVDSLLADLNTIDQRLRSVRANRFQQYLLQQHQQQRKLLQLALARQLLMNRSLKPYQQQQLMLWPVLRNSMLITSPTNSDLQLGTGIRKYPVYNAIRQSGPVTMQPAHPQPMSTASSSTSFTLKPLYRHLPFLTGARKTVPLSKSSGSAMLVNALPSPLARLLLSQSPASSFTSSSTASASSPLSSASSSSSSFSALMTPPSALTLSGLSPTAILYPSVLAQPTKLQLAIPLSHRSITINQMLNKPNYPRVWSLAPLPGRDVLLTPPRLRF